MKPSLGRVPAGGPPTRPAGSTSRPTAPWPAASPTSPWRSTSPSARIPTDLRSLPRPEASWLAALEDPHVPVRIAYSPTLGYATVDAEVAGGLRRAPSGVLASLGAEVVVLDSVFEADPVGDFLTMTGAGQLAHPATLQGPPALGRGPPGAAPLRWTAAQSTTAEQLLQVFDHFHVMNLRLVELFHSVPHPGDADRRGTGPVRRRHDGASVNGESTANWVQFTYPFNMTRSPAASVSVGQSSDGLPIGLQLVGPQHGDLVVLRTAAALEGGHGPRPPAPPA